MTDLPSAYGLTGVVTIPTPPTISLTVTEPEAPSCQIKSYIVIERRRDTFLSMKLSLLIYRPHKEHTL
jgi:hypothetical protein